MNRYLIGLGCSWTQGEGGYTEEVWKSHNGRVQVRGRDDYYLRKMEHENSWVNVLCRDYLKDYTPINLGVRGIGNIAAANQLYFCDRVDFKNSEGIIIFMLSGTERFDLYKNETYTKEYQDDFYSKNVYTHYKYRTSWPFPSDTDKLADVYSKEFSSDNFLALNTITAILNAQTFAKAYNYKFVIANAFNIREPGTKLTHWFKKFAPILVEKINWNAYVHDITFYDSFVEHLVSIDKVLPKEKFRNYFSVYESMSYPSTYLTNCQGAHPTLLGYKVIAEELYKVMMNKKIIQ